MSDQPVVSTSKSSAREGSGVMSASSQPPVPDEAVAAAFDAFLACKPGRGTTVRQDMRDAVAAGVAAAAPLIRAEEVRRPAPIASPRLSEEELNLAWADFATAVRDRGKLTGGLCTWQEFYDDGACSSLGQAIDLKSAEIDDLFREVIDGPAGGAR